jgi:alkanesulfonate monooxygenase SsuD/methylene tetrahydromethanopterin reductase-like flavin-dependent oxidoreductase (luciferase family)
MGMARFVFVAETDREALAIANRAYPVWYRSFNHLFRLHGTTPGLGERPPTFDALIAYGTGIAGSPATVARVLAQQIAESGTNYLVGQFAFGDLSLEETLRSVKLFAADVMPACIAAAGTAAQVAG